VGWVARGEKGDTSRFSEEGGDTREAEPTEGGEPLVGKLIERGWVPVPGRQAANG
jgi:hypothetical protein